MQKTNIYNLYKFLNLQFLLAELFDVSTTAVAFYRTMLVSCHGKQAVKNLGKVFIGWRHIAANVHRSKKRQQRLQKRRQLNQ